MTTRRSSRRHRGSGSRYIYALVVLTLLAGGIAWAVNTCRHNASSANEKPLATASSDLLKVDIPASLPAQFKAYEGFEVNFNAYNRTANYVAWELLPEETTGTGSRKGEKFWQDPDIKNCPETSDYTHSGYDRGHLYPAADAKWSPESMRQCFTMANITPQVHALNGGAWKTLEDKERQWAKRDGGLIIVAGPIYQKSDKTRIGEAGVRVPSAFFKVMLAPSTDTPRAIAFVYPNEHCPGNMMNYAQSVDYVEEVTGFDFFPALPDDVENNIEATFSFKEWNKR